MPVLSNSKHERFAQELAKGATQTDAYTKAGYKPSEQHASRLARNGKVRDRVAELQERGAKRCEITIESLTQMLIEDRTFAKSLGQSATCVSAVNSIAKLNGLVIERQVTATTSLEEVLKKLDGND